MLEHDKRGKYMLYVFDIDSLKSKSWKEIIRNKVYKKEFKFDLDTMKKLNWKIEIDNNVN